MNIVVCIKQVPKTTEVEIDPATGTLIRDSSEAVLNVFDEYALEEAIRIKEANGGTVTAITMGPPQAEAVLRTAIGMGADKGVLITGREFAGADTWATSYTIAAGIKKLGDVDLIICGKQAVDGDTAQVGPGIAELLDVPFIAWIKKIETISRELICAHRMVEEGIEVVEMDLPGLITVVKDINKPRMISLKGKMAARKAELTVFGVNDLDIDTNLIGLNGSPTQVLRSFAPEKKQGGKILSGETDEMVDALVSSILELGIVK